MTFITLYSSFMFIKPALYSGSLLGTQDSAVEDVDE